MSDSYRTNSKYSNTLRQSYTSNNQSGYKSSSEMEASQHQNLPYACPSISDRGKEHGSSKSKSLRKMTLVKHKDELCVECLSNRSSSREKMLENKIEFMLKEQQEKMIQVGCKGNKIKFNDHGPQKINKKDSAYKKRQPTFLSDFLSQQAQNKQNLYHPNKQSKFQPNDTAKSNKLTLRHYINSTPENNRLRQGREQESEKLRVGEDMTQKQEWIDEKKRKSTQKQCSDKVLEEVRELKGIFIELLHSREQIKTRRKTSNFLKDWSQQSKQVFTLP